MSDVRWYIQIEPGKKAGPVSFDKLQQLASEGRFFPETKLRSTEEGAAWITAGELDGLVFPQPESPETPEKPGESTAAPETSGSIFVADEASEEPSAEMKKPTIIINPGKKSSEVQSSASKSPEGSKPAFAIKIGKSSPKKGAEQKSIPKDILGDRSASDDETNSIIVGLDALPKGKKNFSSEKSDQSSQAVKISLGGGAKPKKTETEVKPAKAKPESTKREPAKQKSVKRPPIKAKTAGPESLILKISAGIFLLGAVTAICLPFVPISPKSVQLLRILAQMPTVLIGLGLAGTAWALGSMNRTIELLKQQFDNSTEDNDD